MTIRRKVTPLYVHELSRQSGWRQGVPPQIDLAAKTVRWLLVF
jgi:hypothetical protein